MIKRSQRRHRTPQDLGLRGCGTFFDAFEDAVKGTYRLNDEEYDWLALNATEEETEPLLKSAMSYSEARLALTTLEQLMQKYYTQ